MRASPWLLLAFAALPLPAQQLPAPSPGRGFAPPPLTLDFNDHFGFSPIFDGTTLTGWDGTPDIWSVQDGALTGLSCPDKPSGTTFLIYKGAEPADFELKLEFKIEARGGNSGIQYRSRQEEPTMNPGGPGRGPGPGARGPGGPPADTSPFAPCASRQAPPGTPAPAGFFAGPYTKWNVKGYQFDLGGQAWGNLWEGGRFPGERGTLASAGQAVLARTPTAPGQPNKLLLGNLAPADEVRAAVRPDDWNQLHLIVRGKTLIHIINGRVFNITLDDDDSARASKGVIALQIEGVNLKVAARNLWLKTLQEKTN